MENILKDVNAVMGVTGSFVTDGAGRLLARALPEVFDGETLQLVARNLAQTYSGLEASRKRKVGDIDLVFSDGRLIAKRAGSGMLCILCVKKMNVSLLNLTANVAVRRLGEQLKPAAVPAKKEELPPAVGEAATAVRPAAAGDTPRIQEARTIISAAREHDFPLRVMGDTAIRMCSPSAAALAVAPQDDYLQLAGHQRDSARIEALFKGLGCTPDAEFNVINGVQQLRFVHAGKRLSIEVVLDELASFHRLGFGLRLTRDEWTLTLGDLFLSQIQIVEPGQADMERILALLADFEIGGAGELRAIDGALVAGLCGEDWGWYKTTTLNLAKAETGAGAFQGGKSADNIRRRVRRLNEMIEEAPKSLRWQVRARVGERQPWYEVPE